MLPALLLVAATQVPTAHAADQTSPYAVTATHEMSRHKRHLLHLAHLRYLAWQRDQAAEAEQDADQAPHVTVTSVRVAPGTFTCSELAQLWEAAGGAHWAAFLASEIAMAESGGRSWVISPTSDYGLWQINGSHGSLATLNPYGNARAAVLISHNGSDWYPWTTYVTGAYVGRCLLPAGLTAPVWLVASPR
jgi:Lysozyme like domain